VRCERHETDTIAAKALQSHAFRESIHAQAVKQ